jgi:serine/threonine protein kinase/tetratricopeptide (TPR) repeat protein
MVSPQPSRIGQYEILALLGAGGMGEVYRARDTILRRDVAIKILPPTFAMDPDRMRRLEKEARAASALNHPNIITIHGIGKEGGICYIVTEMISGQTLRERLARARMKPQEAIDVAIQVSEALAATHAAGIVHRDIKPANIMIRPDGYVKVLDFGLAMPSPQAGSAVDLETSTLSAMSQPGAIVGTIRYMAPEQARGMPVDARTDIFSLGVVIYEMIAGSAPFQGPSAAEVFAAILECEPTPLSLLLPEVPTELERIVSKALAKNAEERYQGIKDLHIDLKNLKQDLALRTRLRTHRLVAAGDGETDRRASASTSIPEPPGGAGHEEVAPSTSNAADLLREIRRPRLSMALLAVALLVTVLGYWGVTRLWQPARHTPPPEAQRWHDVGLNAIREGAYFQASKALEHAISIDDRFALAHARLGEAWAELDYTDRAKDELLRVARLVPDRSALPPLEALYLQAVTATATRDFALAIQSYGQIVPLAAGPDKPYAYLDLGRAYEKNENTKLAIENYQEAARLDPQYATAFLRIGMLRGRQQNQEAAEAAFTQADELYQALGNTEGRAEVCYQWGFSLRNFSKIPEAKEKLLQALDLARAGGNPGQQILTLTQLSSVLYAEGDTLQAQKLASQALAAAQQERMESLIVRSYVDVGNVFYTRGNLAEAEPWYQKGLTMARDIRSRRLEARALYSIGVVRIGQSRLDEGLRDVEQALTFYQQGDYRTEANAALTAIARARRDKGDYDGALGAFEQQLELAKKAGDEAQLAYSHDGIATVFLRQERYPEVLDHYEQSYRAYKSLGNKIYVGYGLMNRASALWLLGRYEEARPLFDEVAAMADQPGVPERLMNLNRCYSAEMALSQRRFRDAEARSKLVLASLKNQAGSTVILAKRILGLAQAFTGSPLEGKRQCDEAVTMAKKLRDDWEVSKAQLSLAEVALANGDAKAALAAASQAQESFARSNQEDSEWRALLVCARASQNNGDRIKAREYAANGMKILSSLEQKWGKEAYRDYLSRPDIQFYREQLAQVIKVSN